MFDIVWLTLRLAATTTVALLIIATPLAWWLARSRGWWVEAVAAVVALPIVLPPTVLGFYLLLAMGPDSPLMAPLQALGVRTLAFTFEGLVIGSIVYSLPFAVQPLRNAFEAMGPRPMEAAATLGAGPLDAFFSVAAPLARPGFVVAAVLAFAHTLGEFGVVLMMGGSIPGETKTIAIAIYDRVQAFDLHSADRMALLLLLLSLLAVAASFFATTRLTAAARR
ncbi:MAG: molybdate ABC transporter permease subunit [Betaproteobacteria bacterium]